MQSVAVTADNIELVPHDFHATLDQDLEQALAREPFIRYETEGESSQVRFPNRMWRLALQPADG